MGYSREGSIYFGSDNLKISTIMEEIIQKHRPNNWFMPKILVYKFSFFNNEDCHIIINESANQIFLSAGKGFEMDVTDNQIWSFVIVEAGVTYTYIGGC